MSPKVRFFPLANSWTKEEINEALEGVVGVGFDDPEEITDNQAQAFVDAVTEFLIDEDEEARESGVLEAFERVFGERELDEPRAEGEKEE